MMRLRALLQRNWGPICAFLLPFVVYVRTLAPTVYNLDSAELTTAAATLGITRATGYPLYLLIGHLWSLLPVGDVGYRLNLFSAFCGALTIALLYVFLRRFKISPLATLFGLGLLACAPFFWALSLVAEVYTLHTAMLAGSLVLLQRYLETSKTGHLFVFALWFGLSLGNHMASVLLFPGFLWLVLSEQNRKNFIQPANLFAALGGGVLGLLVYLYLPIRYNASPLFNYAGSYGADGVFRAIDLTTIQGIYQLVSGKGFQSLMFHFEGSVFWPNLHLMALSLSRAFLGFGLAPGVLGLFVMWKKERNWAIALLLIFLANVVFFASYRVIDQETMYLPLYAVWGMWAAFGCQQLLKWSQPDKTHVEANLEKFGMITVRLLLVGVVIFSLFGNWKMVDRSQDWSSREVGESILAQLKPNAIYVGWWDTAPVMQYLQMVEGQRTDVLIINRFLIPLSELEGLIDNLSETRPIYLSDLPQGLPTSAALKIEGIISYEK